MGRIDNQRAELRELCKKYADCNGCPLDDEGCKALEILEKNPMDTASVFEYLKEKES
jgi:hypothetical protein